MNTITLRASASYPITVGSGALALLGQTVRQNTAAEKVCIVSDSHVWPLYGAAVLHSLHSCGLQTAPFIFPAGESSKNLDVFAALLQFLAENHITRTDCIAALGGGVVGDLAGFAAATWLRGIPYIQLPTTLLAMVDSSVGGKTGINLPAGKNLCGAFYQPRAVLCDTDTLNTLPETVFRDGCAEIIKYGVLYDPELFVHLCNHGLAFDRQHIITRCIQWKVKAVEQDELDQSGRKLLNLGHTVGHAIEACSGYTIPHGSAVSIGMAVVSKAAGCPDAGRILALLEQFALPTETAYSAAELSEKALSDKKRCGSCIDLVIPQAIGTCCISSMPTEQLHAFIEKGLSYGHHITSR